MAEADLQSNLPPGWVWVSLDDVCEINPRMVWNNDFTSDMPVTFIPMAAVDDISGKIVKPQVREIASVWKGYTRFSEGDVLFAKITPCMENGKAAIAHGLINGLGFGSTEFHVLRPTEAVEGKWIFYYVRQQSFRDSAARMMTGTAGQLRVPAKYLSESFIPLPPFSEQQRIVEAIEAQFTRLDAGVAALKRLRANLKRYKAAVLKAACEGKLVEQDPDDEPASELLKRILKERRAKWAAEQRAKGKDPRKLTYKEPAAPDTADLPDLPEGWVWATTEQLAAVEKYAMAIGPFGSNLMVKDYRLEGIPLIFVKEIRSGVFDRPDLPRISPEKAEELRSHHVHPGDLVITKMGDPPGDVSIFPDNIPLAVATSDCIKWTLSQYLPNRRYFLYGIRFPIVKNQILKITRGVAQQKMSLARFKGVSIPVAPLSEQNRIVDAIDETLSNISDISELIDANLKRAERLRQSILREAFAGRLVPQDPNDEPAGELLKHIRRDRTRQTNEKKRR